jgi:hypothetical protein
MAYGLNVGFIDTLFTPLGTTGNHSATAILRIFPAYVLTIRFLATASNSGSFSASRAQVLPSPTLVQNCVPAIPSTEVDRRLFTASLAELNCTQHYQTSSLYFYNHFARIELKTSVPTILLMLLVYSLRLECVYRAVA